MNEWTEKEIVILKNNYSILNKEELLEIMPKRTWLSIMAKAEKIGLISKRTSQKWTDENVLFLLDNYGKISKLEISKALGKTKEQVERKVEGMSLTLGREKIVNSPDYKKILFYIDSGLSVKKSVEMSGTKYRYTSILKELLRDKNYKKRIFWKDFSNEDILKMFKDTCEELGFAPIMSDLVKYGLPAPEIFKQRFGTYSNACFIVGIDENSSFGKVCYSVKGDKCLSFLEKIITDFLIEKNIFYKKEYYYKNIIPIKTNERCDWYLYDGTVVEYFGLYGRKDYDQKIKKKLSWCKKNNIEIISIYPNQVNKTDLMRLFYNKM